MIRTLFLTLAFASSALAANLGEDPYALEGRAMREPNNLQVLLTAGRIFTRRYDEGKKADDLAKASSFLERATKVDPKSNEAMARYAVTKALQARDKNDKALAKQALKDLDQAVTNEPENPLLKALRGYVGVEVPGDWGRLDLGLADLQAVEAAVKKDGSIAAKLNLDMPKVYFKLGKAYRAKGNLGEAKRAWEASIAADPNSRDAQNSKKQLSKF